MAKAAYRLPILVALGALFVVEDARAVRPEPTATTIDKFAYASSTADDRVSPSVVVKKDGAPDWRFSATVRGNVASLILTICSGGKHTISHWDTVPLGVRMPKGFQWEDGAPTWVLGVIDKSGRLLNRDDGSIAAKTYDEPTALELHAAQNGFLKSGTTVCLSVLGADGSVVARAETKLP